jgi:kynurenine formamidase
MSKVAQSTGRPVSRRSSAALSGRRASPRAARVISLTHALHEAIPVWPGDPPLSIEPVASHEADGYFLQRITLGEHSGTHLVAPRSYHVRGASADELPDRMLILPAVAIDKSRAASHNPDYVLQTRDIEAWEVRHGRIEPGVLFLLHTGWSALWPQPERFLNQDRDGRMHFPGISRQAIECLVEERGVAGVGIDTHGIDGGLDESFAASRRLLEGPRIALENLANLGRLPLRGALVFIGALPIRGGSGAPARVLALIP